MSKQIRIYQNDIHNWMAEYLQDGKPCPRITQLFGTHTLPTPYFLTTPSDFVVAQIAALNPGTEVLVA